MRTEDLNYDLPAELIAQRPAEVAGEDRMLVLGRGDGSVKDRSFADIGQFLRDGDCLVLNDTKVLPARFYGHRQSGARIQGLLLSENDLGQWVVMLKNSRKIKPGETLVLIGRDGADWGGAKAISRYEDGTWLIEPQAEGSAEAILGKIGFAPLPPYIKRDSDSELTDMDIQRYQTVYADKAGAVAAPTAGLHFTQELLEELEGMGVRLARVTLHVGAGTFKPVTAEDLDDHDIHSEWYSIDEENAGVINAVKGASGRIIAVGTTSVRTLETVASDGRVRAASGSTKLFIQPGYEYGVVDGMVTNFHLPKSTLLALVGAFAGLDNVMAAYRHAIEGGYKFFSYGDAMLIV